MNYYESSEHFLYKFSIYCFMSRRIIWTKLLSIIILVILTRQNNSSDNNNESPALQTVNLQSVCENIDAKILRQKSQNHLSARINDADIQIYLFRDSIIKVLIYYTSQKTFKGCYQYKSLNPQLKSHFKTMSQLYQIMKVLVQKTMLKNQTSQEYKVKLKQGNLLFYLLSFYQKQINRFEVVFYTQNNNFKMSQTQNEVDDQDIQNMIQQMIITINEEISKNYTKNALIQQNKEIKIQLQNFEIVFKLRNQRIAYLIQDKIQGIQYEGYVINSHIPDNIRQFFPNLELIFQSIQDCADKKQQKNKNIQLIDLSIDKLKNIIIEFKFTNTKTQKLTLHSRQVILSEVTKMRNQMKFMKIQQIKKQKQQTQKQLQFQNRIKQLQINLSLFKKSYTKKLEQFQKYIQVVKAQTMQNLLKQMNFLNSQKDSKQSNNHKLSLQEQILAIKFTIHQQSKSLQNLNQYVFDQFFDQTHPNLQNQNFLITKKNTIFKNYGGQYNHIMGAKTISESFNQFSFKIISSRYGDIYFGIGSQQMRTTLSKQYNHDDFIGYYGHSGGYIYDQTQKGRYVNKGDCSAGNIITIKVNLQQRIIRWFKNGEQLEAVAISRRLCQKNLYPVIIMRYYQDTIQALTDLSINQNGYKKL